MKRLGERLTTNKEKRATKIARFFFHSLYKFLAAMARLCLAFHAFTFSHKIMCSSFIYSFRLILPLRSYKAMEYRYIEYGTLCRDCGQYEHQNLRKLFLHGWPQ